MVKFTKKLGEEGITLTSLKSMSEYNRTSDLLQEFMNDQKNLKDTLENQKNIELMKVVLTNRDSFIAASAQNLDDVMSNPNDKTALDNLLEGIRNDLALVNRLQDEIDAPFFSMHK